LAAVMAVFDCELEPSHRSPSNEHNGDVAPTIVPASIIMGAMESLLIITGTTGGRQNSVLWAV
jgi:hypothetical protein